MKANSIISTLFVVLLGWIASIAVAHASVGANPNDYTTKIMLERFEKAKKDLYAASKTTGIDMADLTAIASIESGLNQNAKNPHSSASGMLGHTKGTWVSDRKAYHSKLGLPKNVSVKDRKASLLIGAESLQDSKKFLVERTHLSADQVRAGDLYMSHFLGRDKAVKVINSNSNLPISKVVRITKGNWSMFVKPNGKVRTAREFRLYLDQKVKNERAFYAAYIQQYVFKQQGREQMVKAANDLDNHDMTTAISNTEKYVGFGT